MANENHNHNDDPLEEFFRTHSEQYDIEYKEDDWLKLEKRLDAADARRSAQKLWIWVAAASLLLFGMIGYFTYQNKQEINRLNEQLAEQAPETGTPREYAPVTESQGQDEQSESPRNNSAESPAGGDMQEESTASPSQESSTPLAPTPVDDASQQELAATAPDSSASDPLRTRQVARLYEEDFSCYGCSLSSISSSSWDPIPFLMASDASNLSATEADNNQPEITDRQPLGSSITGSPKAASPLAVGLAVGPDLSTVGALSNFSKPGYQIGIGIEYQLTPQIAVKTGVARADVRYTAYGSDYQPPAGYWTNGTVADKTIARCAILEIPLALKFNVWELGKSRIIATGGISSYIMLNEKYEFNYNDPGYGLAESWSGNTGTRHWFSNASLSVGYELDLLPSTSLRIEPFIKLPLKEVGWGNVKLYSTGTSVSLNLRL